MNLLYANDNPGEHAASWYAATADIPHYDSLTDSLDVDVCVIGAGYTGLSTALTLATKNISVCLLDAHRIGWGASGRNGGQLGSGFNRHDAITQSLGKPASQRYWALSERAKAFVLNTCQQYNINADYQVGIVSTLHRPVSTRQLFAAVESENQLHASANFVALDKQALQDHIRSEQYYGGVFDPNAGHLHPLKLAIGFAKAAAAEGALLFEQSAVNRIERANDGFKVHTAAGSVSAKNVVCAMNGYLDGLEPKARRDVIPINNFIKN